MKQPFRIVVCGTGFGRAWIDAIVRCRRQYQLVGVIARGSVRSREICIQYGIPLATSVNEVKASVDAAVVAIGGRAGEEVANEWLRRGVPVILEHPVGPKFISNARRRGKKCVRLQINGHFCELPTVQRFIKICRACSKGKETSTAAIIATPRTLYSCLDIALALLPPGDLVNIRFRRGDLDALGNPEYYLGSLRLKVSLMASTSVADDAAGSLGGHFVQLWLSDQRITLLGPTGPIVSLSTFARRRATWILQGGSTASSWNKYCVEHRPKALIAALDRLVRNSPKASFRNQLHRHLLVAKIWDDVLRSRNVIRSESS